ncbi:MAG: SpoIIE family protein phosphatase [Victivallales bacterium]|jgi:hypothetical protein|nr:SpoIIE family protein phosphatase [Victivallales bacterium]
MNLTTENLFIDTGYSQCCHYGEKVCGDAIAFKRIPAEERLLAVLADGLGHGIKASILAQMTTTMALRFSAEDREVLHSAEIIMDSLPVCQVRQISYATFTIVDTRLGGITRIVEMGNPEFLLFRGGKMLPTLGFAALREEFFSPKYKERKMTAFTFQAQPNDRVLFMSDGVTQSGLGSPHFPLGWRNAGVIEYVTAQLAATPDISAQELTEKILREAIAHEPGMRPADDITAACLYFRKPHCMLLFTGPPFDQTRDAECAKFFHDFKGTKVISGGTTAEIISRELNSPLELLLDTITTDLPPISRLKGADLVTEGIFTLSRAATYLENGEHGKNDPAGQLVELMRKNDIIDFLVGTRINEAHQDPNLPIDLELRRNIIKRIATVLRDRYMKEVRVTFV